MVAVHAAAAAGARWVCQAPLNPLGNQQVHAPGHPVLGFGGVFVCLFWVFLLFFSLLCERRNRKKAPFSNWLTQTLQDKSWKLRLEKGLSLAPELKAPEKIKCFLLGRRTFLACSGAHLPWYSQLPLLSSKRDSYS